MNIEAFVICDAATEYGGKLNVLGAFDTIFAKEMPAVHPFCAVALRLRFTKVEQGSHNVRISFVDADGHSILPNLDAGVQINIGPNDQSVCANLVLNISGLKFPKPGAYSIDLAVDSRHEKSLPVFVRPIPPHVQQHLPGQQQN
jgi:hypothetical protein